MSSQKAPWAPVHGVLLLDKPRGITSQQALFKVRKRLLAAKAGHGGTLDPLADGLLILCFGAATKFAQRHLEADKRYTAVLQLGVRTSTDDAEGEVIQTRPVANIDRAAVDAVLHRFIGLIDQVPPIHSALKRDGRPLYAYARAGEAIDVPARRVRVDAIDVLSCAGDTLVLDVRCGKGTYIRSLARDIGEALGCGAHLAALRRTESGGFGVGQAMPLDAVEALSTEDLRARLLPPDALLHGVPRQELDDVAAQRFLHGQRLAGIRPTEAVADGAEVRVYGASAPGQPACLLGLGTWSEGVFAPLRLLSADELSVSEFPRPRAASVTLSEEVSLHQDVCS